MPADLIVTNGRLWPVTTAPRPGAVAVAGGRIAALGDADDVLWLRGPSTRVLDAAGGTVLPGLRDAHIHLFHWALGLERLDLRGLARDEVLAAVAERAATTADDDWIEGAGWDHRRIEAPTAAELDAHTGGRPAVLWSQDFHAIWASTAALRAAGLGPTTTDPFGGSIVRDRRGDPTGLLLEKATDAMQRALPGPSPERADAALACAQVEMHRRGVVAVDEMASLERHDVYGRAAARGDLRLRVRLMVRAERFAAIAGLGLPPGGDGRLTLGGVKVFADGTLGARTAWMLAPYDDRPESIGIPGVDAGELRALAVRVARAGLPLVVHAIGDAAVRVALDAVEAAREVDGGRLAHRIEHAQIVAPADVERFARLGVVASVQPSHLLTDRDEAVAAWGARTTASYAWRTLLDAGVRLAFGSDAPVEPPDPWRAIRAAVLRTEGGRAPFHPEQALSLDEAIAASVAGPLAVGAPADLVVHAEDLARSGAVERLDEAGVRATVLGGEIVHEA